MRARLWSLTLALAAFLVFHAVIVTAALHYGLGVPRAETLAHHVDVLLTGTPGGDSWKPMATASRFAAGQPGASIYEEVFFRRGMKFQYPPSALLLTSRLERPALHLLSWLASGSRSSSVSVVVLPATPFNVLQSSVQFGALLLLTLWYGASRHAPSA